MASNSEDSPSFSELPGVPIVNVSISGENKKKMVSLCEPEPATAAAPAAAFLSRKEKRKQMKILKRKQIRQQVAEEERLKERAEVDVEAEQLRDRLEEQLEAELLAREKAEHDEQERLWLEREKRAMEEFEKEQEKLRKLEEDRKNRGEDDLYYKDEDDDRPPEIIWIGNEIIVKKKRVKALADLHALEPLQDDTQSASNPLPPQSAAFAAHNSHNKCVQIPAPSDNAAVFGTEQDKTHCPFHIKTGVCRFGVRCSRVHVYPDQSSTLLVRNMYTGPGLSWENEEALENSVEQGSEGRWMQALLVAGRRETSNLCILLIAYM